MKKTLLLAAIAAVLLAACASAPDPVPPPDAEYDEAKALRTQIEDLGLAQYAQAQYTEGEAAFTQGETHYDVEEFAEAGTQFNAAIRSYEEVIQIGLGSIRTAKKGRADEAKLRADNVKANVAVAEDYSEALAVYQQAQVAAEAGDDELAAELFENAETLFEAAYELAAEKKAQAEAALSTLDSSITDLDAQRQDLEAEAREDLETAGTVEPEEAGE